MHTTLSTHRQPQITARYLRMFLVCSWGSFFTWQLAQGIWPLL